MPWVHLYLLALASEQKPASQHVTMLETQTPTQWETGSLEAHGWRMPWHVGAGGLRGHPFLPQLDSFKALNKFLVLNGSICETHQGVLWNLISVHQLGWRYCLCTSFLSFAFFFFHSAALESRVNSPQDTGWASSRRPSSRHTSCLQNRHHLLSITESHLHS